MDLLSLLTFSAFDRALVTYTVLSSILVSLKVPNTASNSSWVDMLTNANPRERPLSLSCGTKISDTVPNSPKTSYNVSLVVSKIRRIKRKMMLEKIIYVVCHSVKLKFELLKFIFAAI